MMRDRWTEVSLDMYDFLQHRVDALVAHVEKLENKIKLQERELEILRGFDDDATHETKTDGTYPVPSVFFQSLPMQDSKEVITWI